MPVDQIPEDRLFNYVPLKARLQAGQEKVRQLAYRQRDHIEAKVAENEGPPIVEARVTKITGSGKVKMRFTSPIEFPEDLKDKINGK